MIKVVYLRSQLLLLPDQEDAWQTFGLSFYSAVTETKL
jgi:hypothetical protein